MMLALILTVILEAIVLLLLREKDALFYLFWISITTVTNIPANLIAARFFSGGKLMLCLAIAIIELAVFISEALLCFLYTKDRGKSIKYSALCNLASFGIGSLITMIF